MAYGGYTSTNLAVTESWNGSAWTETADLNTARHDVASFGIYTAAIAAGGYGPNTTAITENWNGSAWTEVGDLNTARYGIRGAIQGTTTAGLVFGGETGPTGLTITEDWNGASWTEVADLSQKRRYATGTGNLTSALAIGGDANPGESLTAVEEWSSTSNSTKTISTD